MSQTFSRILFKSVFQMKSLEGIEEHHQKSVHKFIDLDIRDMDAVYTMGLRSYLFVDTLGTGTYSTVYKAVISETRNALFPEEVAIKVLKHKKYVDGMKREIAIVDRLINKSHPNIIDFKERFKSRDYKINYLVSELAQLGDLFEVLQKINHLGHKVWRPLRPKYCRHFIKGIALGLQHLFCLGVSHGDIKLENILVNWCEPTPNTPQDFSVSRFMRMIPKLTDFNNSKIEDPGVPIISYQSRCSPVTAAPESLHFQTHYDMKIADVYSVGACLLEMLLACHPFIPSNDTPEDELPIRCALLKQDIDFLDQLIKPFDPILKQVLLKILEPEPQNRITIEEFLEDDWLRQEIDSS